MKLSSAWRFNPSLVETVIWIVAVDRKRCAGRCRLLVVNRAVEVTATFKLALKKMGNRFLFLRGGIAV